MSIAQNIIEIKKNLPESVKLLAVSKFKTKDEILEAYNAGQRIFAENKVQELCEKFEILPKDIEWHFIGHLQTNKVKFIAPFVSMIHSVDSLKLLEKIDAEAAKHNRVIPVLFEIHVADEDSKFGFSPDEILEICRTTDFGILPNVQIAGLMGMATFTDDQAKISEEFARLQAAFRRLKNDFFKENFGFKEISAGMSDDYPLAIRHGSTMVRVGSKIFGMR